MCPFTGQGELSWDSCDSVITWFMSNTAPLTHSSHPGNAYVFFFLIFYLFLERGREGEREGEKHQCVVVSHGGPTGDLALNLGMCSDWESNRQPFGSQAGVQSTESHHRGLKEDFVEETENFELDCEGQTVRCLS